MTTSRTPFVPLRAASLIQFKGVRRLGLTSRLGWGALALALGPFATAEPPTSQAGPPGTPAQTGAQPSSRIVPLTKEDLPGAAGPRELFDGHHIRWERDDVEENILTLGPAVPTRTLISVIERRIDQQGGRDAGLSVEDLGSVLLIRGGPGTSAEDLDRAAATAREAVSEFQSFADAMRFRTRVSLTASGEGVPAVDVIQTERTLLAGTRTALGERTIRPFVADFDVEVATGQSIADPGIAVVETGETLHLWASTTLDAEGVRRLHVQGLLDIAIETDNQMFDPNVYELGVLEQPRVTTYQVMFAGTIPSGAPLVVTLDGLEDSRSQRRLELWAEPALAEPTAARSQRILDLSRGMWRGSLNPPHALSDSSATFQVPDSRMPASAAQLMALMFARERLPRPDLGSSALFLVDGQGAGANTNFAMIQALFESIDPAGPTQTVRFNSSSGGLRASLPATLGALVRVARTEETVLVLDYDPQIANEATLSDPASEIFLAGEVMEGVLELVGDVPQLRGFASKRTLSDVRVRAADPIDVGRIQHPVTLVSATEFLAVTGKNVLAAGMGINLVASPK